MALLDDRLGALLVRGIAIGMQEQDGDRLDACGRPRRRRRARTCSSSSGISTLPCAVDALARSRSAASRSISGSCLLEEQIVGFRPVDAADLVDVAKALRGQQRAVRAGALQDGVDRDGGAVQEQPRRARSCASGLGARQCSMPSTSRAGVVSVLPSAKLAGRLVESGDVGEGAADVGRQPNLTQLHRAQTELRAAGRRKRRYQPRSTRRNAGHLLRPAAALLAQHRHHLAGEAGRSTAALSSSVKSPKANWPTT